MSLSRKGIKIFYGWWVLLGCATIVIYLASTYYYGFTAFFNPIAAEFAWGYAIVALASSFQGFESGLLSPVVGILVDRFGIRKLLFTAAVLMGFGFLLFSRIDQLWLFYVAAVLLATGSSFIYPVVVMTAIARWFRKRITLAMGFLTASHAIGGLMVPVVVLLIDHFGWREVLMGFGLGAWIIILPLILLVKEPPAAAVPSEPEPGFGKTPDISDGLTAREAIRTREFWLLGIAGSLGRISVVAAIVHQIPYMVSIGISRPTAGLLVMIFAGSNLTGRLFLGWLADILDKKYCFAASVFVIFLGVLFFAMSESVSQMIPSLIAMGVGFGGWAPIFSSFQIELFGRKSYGTITGLTMAFLATGAVVAPPFAGWVFDFFGSYRPAFLILGACNLLAIPMVLAISRQSLNAYRQKLREGSKSLP